MSHVAQHTIDPGRYAKCVEVSKRVRWDTDRDVIRGRSFDFGKKFLPDGLSKVGQLPFLTADEQRLFSQVQGRTYANMFALVERFISAKVLEISRGHWLGDQVALEALVRLTDEELKHQELFRRLDRMAAEGMPEGYCFKPPPNEIARAVLSKSTWAVLALTLDIELLSQSHYRSSIECDAESSELWRDVFLFHWKEESQHAILDELEWRRIDAQSSALQREQGVDDFVGLLLAIDGTLQVQARTDAAYFLRHGGRAYSAAEQSAVHDLILKAYRWQYIATGVQEPRFVEVLRSLVTPEQFERIAGALAPILAHAGD